MVLCKICDEPLAPLSNSDDSGLCRECREDLDFEAAMMDEDELDEDELDEDELDEDELEEDERC